MNSYDIAFPDRIVSLLSYSAGDWAHLGLVPQRSSPNEAIQIYFKFIDPQPTYGTELLAQITSRLSTPYIDNDWISRAWIVIAKSEDEADVVLTFNEGIHEGKAAMHYILWSKNKGSIFQVGWYPFLFEVTPE